MAYDFQVTVDAGQPHILADWWADALGWEVEPTDAEFIRRMISEGYATEGDTTTHNGALAGRLAQQSATQAAQTAAAAGSCSSLFPNPRRRRTGSTWTCAWAQRTSRPRWRGCPLAARPSCTGDSRDRIAG
jgi:hypothetical protein